MKKNQTKSIVITTQYHCGNCEGGIVEVVQVETKHNRNIKVKKCNKCNHQYGLKGLMSIQRIPLS